MEVSMALLDDVKRNALRQWIPPARLQLDRWIEENIILPSSISALPGKVKLYAYQRAIAEAITDPLYERVSLVKASRLGFSTLLVCAIGHFATNEPASTIVVLPTADDARNFTVDHLEPLFAASPVLRDTLSEAQDETGRNTLLHRRYPGGSLRIIPARSPRNLRAHTARVLLADELDAWVPTEEGSPLQLAIQRTLTYNNRKIICGSTPVHADTSAICAAYAASDQRIYECPCPECGGFTELLWRHVEWEPDHPETAAFRCPHCKGLVHEKYKPQMVSRGEWRATRPEIVGHAGFRLNSLVSPLMNASWSKLAAEFLAAKDHPELLQVFINTALAEPWSGPGGDLQEDRLQSRAEEYSLENIPAEVLCCTLGADLQDDRVEASVLGWTRSGECLILGHFIVWGSFADSETWAEFDELLKSKWRHPWGGQLKIDAAVVDAGDGDHFDHVLAFCVPRANRRIFGGKGMYGNRPGFQMAKGKRIAGKLALIGVDVLKSVIFDRLARGQGIRFSRSLEANYFEQLASQRRVVRYHRGMPTRRFEMVSARARKEALDCLTYGWAARQALGNINFAMREEYLKNPGAPRRSLAELLAEQLPH
jgi:phage terminase large subunit GpA-like protein